MITFAMCIGFRGGLYSTVGIMLRPLGVAFCGQWAQGISVTVVLVEELVEVWDADGGGYFGLMDASHDMIAASSMAGVGRGSSVTNRRWSRHESSAAKRGFTGICRICKIGGVNPWLSCASCTSLLISPALSAT